MIAPFLLILATAFLVGPLVYFAGKNKERPIVFSLFISLGVGIYLLVFQLVVIYFRTEFGLIGRATAKYPRGPTTCAPARVHSACNLWYFPSCTDGTNVSR